LIGAPQRVFPIGKIEPHTSANRHFAEASAEPSPKLELLCAPIARQASRGSPAGAAPVRGSNLRCILSFYDFAAIRMRL
jgi:hypothetical protein